MKVIKISDKAYEELSKLSQQFSLSIADTVEKLIDFFKYPSVSSEKPVKSKLDVEIFLKYPAKCVKCKRELGVGERVRYIRIDFEDGSRDIVILCEDCNLSSSLLAKYYRKKREYEVIVKELKKEADSLVEKIKKLEVEYDIKKVKSEVQYLFNEVKHVMLEQDKNRLEEVIQKLNELEVKVESLEKLKKPIVIYKFSRKKS